MERACIPASGRDDDELLTDLASFRDGDVDWKGGRTWSLVYPAGDAHKALLDRAHGLYSSTNGLNPMAFKSLRRLESEVVQMTASLLHGPDSTAGTMTSGGTESILLAVKAARDRARRRKPWLRHPEMVLPRTLHVAFDKAGHYFGVRPRWIPTRPDGRADADATARAINRRTVLVAGSAPSYPHGVVDPISDLAAVASKRGIPMHVDACFGGFLLPWLERLGVALPPWDFRVPGVTSISADAHKYGYAAKGASVLLYRDVEHLKHQIFVSTDWPGGIYASPTIAGTRPGGPIAAAWTSMQSLGEEGYLRLAAEALAVTRSLRAGIEAIDGLALIGGDLQSTIVTWHSIDPAVDTYAVGDQLAERGWGVDRQQFPASIHCSANASNAPVVDTYLADLREAVARVRAHPELASEGEAAMYGMMSKVPIRGLVAHSVREVIAATYAPGADASPDLANVGGSADDGLLLRLIGEHGDKATALLDRFARLRKRKRKS